MKAQHLFRGMKRLEGRAVEALNEHGNTIVHGAIFMGVYLRGDVTDPRDDTVDDDIFLRLSQPSATTDAGLWVESANIESISSTEWGIALRNRDGRYIKFRFLDPGEKFTVKTAMEVLKGFDDERKHRLELERLVEIVNGIEKQNREAGKESNDDQESV